ncbi:Ubiquitin carboxyl-terminal hydrolase family protein [Clavispora lusitaniae]|uniref:Ubiquitin carboxyl-terminal hydrolase family protein n=1 Tax=Clavispora lusitaniae TaxID=36911 RepID=UPI00202C205D|nr:Ubiquitin carboxyl-terminal hydrolase family protein [Clavispora lusitaniae]
MAFTISIKNAGKVHEIELEDSATGLEFKKKIQDITQIPVERQKILIKGGKLSDDVVVSTLKANLKNPIMVLGTPDKDLPVFDSNKHVFLEDLNENQLVKVAEEPSGLINLGNTCYLNSSLQALYNIKDISDKVKSSSGSTAMITTLKGIFNAMGKKQQNVDPTLFLMQFRAQFPQFAEQEMGMYKQQDAEEAFSQIMTVLGSTFDINDAFRIDFKTVTKCLSLPEEEPKIGSDSASKLSCHIDIKTNFLRDGIINGLTDKLEKRNETLNANAEYEITKTITRLPKYLTVHFMRFFWRRDTRKKSKILRKVQFPFELDLSEMLDPSIKQEKIEVRDKLRKIEKDNDELIRDFKKAKKDKSLTPKQQQEEDELKIESIKSKFMDDFAGILPKDFSFETATENPSSVYELQAIITHQGSSADSGHYQAFVKNEKDLEGGSWWKFNDNKVSSVNRDKIEALAGGGESDSALILIYKAKGF